MKTIDDLFTQNYTEVHCECKEDQKFDAPCNFIVRDAKTLEVIGSVHFQEGPIKEHGINGINNEDALLMVLTRLKSFQEGPYKCEENEEAIEHLKSVVKSLRNRTNKREKRGIIGTSEV